MDGVKHKKITGYTTGVFDLFHVGHLNILRTAREQCDHLIVGVSTDELCRSYKGKTPLIPFEERKAIVEAVKYVDEVCAQTDRDKFKAWTERKFDVLFVGDDWKGTPFFEELEARFSQVGVRIVYIPYTSGVSATLLKERILRHDEV